MFDDMLFNWLYRCMCFDLDIDQYMSMRVENAFTAFTLIHLHLYLHGFIVLMHRWCMFVCAGWWFHVFLISTPKGTMMIDQCDYWFLGGWNHPSKKRCWSIRTAAFHSDHHSWWSFIQIQSWFFRTAPAPLKEPTQRSFYCEEACEFEAMVLNPSVPPHSH